MVVLTASACWGHGEQKGCTSHVYSPHCGSCVKWGGRSWATNMLLVTFSQCAWQPLSSHCSPCVVLPGINPLLLQGAEKSSALPMDDGLESACNKSPVNLVPQRLKMCLKAGLESPKSLH